MLIRSNSRVVFRMLYSSLFIILTFSACQNDQGQRYARLIEIVDQSRSSNAPDKRVALFNVKAEMAQEKVVLKGETDQLEGLELMINELTNEGFQIDDQVLKLPDSDLNGRVFAIVNNSVSNIRSKPKHSGELATQAILGMQLKVLKQEGEWYLVQTPDDYISWMDHGGLVVMNEQEFSSWNEQPKLVFTKPFGYVFSEPDVNSLKISDLVLGNLLVHKGTANGFEKVRFPDGREGYVESDESKLYAEWLVGLKPTGEGLKSTAQELMGAPYLWGGTSAKGMDCSGFTKTIYFMNGLVIPRDASQQVKAGMEVDANNSFAGLKLGDLLFFGKPMTDSTRQRVTHVGMWIGNDEFIHASQRVRVSSINPEAVNYDEFNKNRYLGSQRYLDNLTGNIEALKANFHPSK